MNLPHRVFAPGLFAFGLLLLCTPEAESASRIAAESTGTAASGVSPKPSATPPQRSPRTSAQAQRKPPARAAGKTSKDPAAGAASGAVATTGAGAAAAGIAAATTPGDAPAIGYAARDEVRRFISDMGHRHGFDETYLARLFAQVRFSDTIVRLSMPAPPGFKRSWQVYRSRFIDPIRIREGLRFWQSHAADIARASEVYGIPEEIIVSIIGVETVYGRVTGDFRVLDALTVLSFDELRRAAFFREELEHFLLLTREQGSDPLSWRGSFAGAIGLPQFMPGSIRRYAVDFDGDGRIDLVTSPVDAIGSVARFLAEHGWRRGEPTHFTARISSDARVQPLLDAGIEPRWSSTELAQHGVRPGSPMPADARVALIDLPNADAPPTLLLGAQNFYVITRYNRSSFYAMAVIDLAQALKAGR